MSFSVRNNLFPLQRVAAGGGRSGTADLDATAHLSLSVVAPIRGLVEEVVFRISGIGDGVLRLVLFSGDRKVTIVLIPFMSVVFAVK